MDFLGKTYKIRSKTEKVNTTIKFYIYEISPKKPKKKKENHHRILHIWISLGSTNNTDFSKNISEKRVLPAKTRKDEYHHWILDFRISLSTKFELKLTILIFSTKFAQKTYSQPKTKKINSTMEFCIFQLV